MAHTPRPKILLAHHGQLKIMELCGIYTLLYRKQPYTKPLRQAEPETTGSARVEPQTLGIGTKHRMLQLTEEGELHCAAAV